MMNIYQLVSKAVGQKLKREEFNQYLQDKEMAFEVLCNQIATHLAKNYLLGKLDFYFCDQVMNRINTFMIDALFENIIETLPEPADSIYLAFDQGEYHHSNDDRDRNIDPAEKYTKPRLQEIMTQLNQSHHPQQQKSPKST